MKRIKLLAVCLLAMGALGGIAGHNHTLCEGFVPENDMKIPVSAVANANLDEALFNEVIDRAVAYYDQEIKDKGATLKVNRLWNNDTVNASAQQQGRTWIINMYGGLARHPQITYDGFLIVVCHELGHHLGGAPKKRSFFGTMWASNEGQSDYWATLKCFHNIYTDAENEAFHDSLDMNTLDAAMVNICKGAWNTKADLGACYRAGLAGMSTAMLFKELKKQNVDPKFDTPDKKKVGQTNHNHPDTQCRLDTYFNGGLCDADPMDDVDNKNVLKGTCNRKDGYQYGVRPNCWYKD